MKNRFQIKSFITAAFFLVAYLNVFATQASCNLPHFFEQATKSTSHHDNSTDHHHGDKNALAHHHNKKGAEKDSNCCNDKTTAFFANQGNHIIYSVDFKNTFCTELIFANALLDNNLSLSNSNCAISYSLPPPKIPDIRVFIQSFII